MSDGGRGPDRRTGATSERSPWQPGADGTFEIEIVANASTPAAAEPDRRIVASGSHGDTDDGSDPDHRRRWWTFGVLAIVAVLGVSAAVALSNSDDDPDSAPPTVPTPVESLPPTTPIDEDADEVTVATTPDAEESTGAPGVTETTSGGAPLPLRVELPAALATQTRPTEILALTADGSFATISIPSGALRIERIDRTTSPDPFFLFGSSIVVAPSAAAFRSTPSDISIVRREGGVVTVTAADIAADDAAVEVQAVGWVRAADGTDRFVVRSYGGPGSGAMALVDLDGGIEQVDLDTSTGVGEGLLGARYARGVGYFGSGGQVFRFVAGEPVSLVGPGELLFVVEASPVVRRCPSPTECITEIVDGDGDVDVAVDPALVGRLQETFPLVASISPDGATVATMRFDDASSMVLTPSDSGAGAERVVDLGAGYFSGEVGWVADGSAIVIPPIIGNDDLRPTVDGVRLESIDPAVDGVVFAEEVGAVIAVATRFPDEELPPPTLVDTRSLPDPGTAARLPTVIVADRGGSISRIDFAGGEVTDFRTTLTRAWTGGRAAQVITLDDSVVVLDDAGEDGVLIRGETVLAPPTWPAGERFALDGGHIWAAVVDGETTHYRPVDVQGAVVVDDLEGAGEPVPAAAVIGTDGAGAIVYEVAGDVWSTDGVETVRLTTGDLLALNGDQAIVHECDAGQRCEVARIIPATRTRRVIETSEVGPVSVGAGPRRNVAIAGSLSPDGRTALVELAPGMSPSTWGLVDLQTNAIVPVGTPYDHQPIIWSDDSGTALLVTDGELHVFDRAAGTIDPIVGFGFVVALGVDAPEQ